jgi:hypothetical protein
MLKTAIPFVKAAAGALLLAAVLFSRASEAAPPVEPKLGDYWARYFIACETYKAAKERLRATFAELLLPGSPPFHERVKYEVWYPEFRELRRKANVLAGMLPGLKNACEQSKATYEQALQTYVNAALEDLMSSPPTAAAPPRSTRSPTTTKKPPTGTTRGRQRRIARLLKPSPASSSSASSKDYRVRPTAQDRGPEVTPTVTPMAARGGVFIRRLKP